MMSMSYRIQNSIRSFIMLLLLTFPSKLMAIDELPYEMPSKLEINKLRSAVIFTNKGNIRIELYPEAAPQHIANLKYLSDKGFYKNLKFHIYIPDYIIQGGDPSSTGNGGPGYSLPPEFSKLIHTAGTFGMSRIKDSQNPERLSNGSQFHILLSSAPRMDNEYTIMGKVISGMNIVKKLRKGDKIEDLIVYVRQ